MNTKRLLKKLLIVFVTILCFVLFAIPVASSEELSKNLPVPMILMPADGENAFLFNDAIIKWNVDLDSNQELNDSNPLKVNGFQLQIIHYNGDTEDILTIDISNVNMRVYEIELMPEHYYAVRIRTYSSEYVSNWSDIVAFKTDENPYEEPRVGEGITISIKGNPNQNFSISTDKNSSFGNHISNNADTTNINGSVEKIGISNTIILITIISCALVIVILLIAIFIK